MIDQTLISKSLSKHFIFSALLNDPATHNDLIESFKYCSLSEDQYLLKENDQASSFFILDEGLLQVEINGVAKKRLYSGEGFGELALLYSAPRSASIKALKDSFLWYIERKTFSEFVTAIINNQYTETR